MGLSEPRGEAIRLEALGLSYGARAALTDVSLEAAPGDRLAVIGRSGAGKTTLLRLVAGLAAPSAGRVLMGEREASAPGRVLVPPEARGVGLVFQELALWPHLDVEATLRWVARGTRHERREAARRWAARVGLGERMGALPSALSGGERQRLALARALAAAPRTLLLDEPFAHLDPPLRAELGAELLALAAEEGVTLLLVTHQRAEVLELAQRVAVLEAGALVEHAPLDQLLATPRRAETARLLGLGNVVPGEPGGPGRLRTALGELALAGEAAARAALVRPEELELVSSEEGTRATVRRAAVGRPDALAKRFDVVVAVGELELRVAHDEPVLVGQEVSVRARRGPFAGLE